MDLRREEWQLQNCSRKNREGSEFILVCGLVVKGFPGDSAAKNSLDSEGDLRDIVESLFQEDPLEEGMATHTRILAGEFHGQRSQAGYSPWRHKQLDIPEAT